ncbi:hypothetical protein ABI59_18110 [Acidobacteria bacterium Mor1]|nr:hypothetical protein ABI59_18110 [Acidobacteria bacterium Mor1]
MTRSDDDLLWQPSRLDTDVRRGDLDDEILAAYRAGQLDDESTRQIEALLCRNADARRRLADLGGVIDEKPSPAARRAAIEGQPYPAEQASTGRSGSRIPLAAAAMLLLALPLGLFAWSQRSQPFPADLSFAVQVQGMAAERAGERMAAAYPDTSVEVTVEPMQAPRAGMLFALYRVDPGRLMRIDPGLDVELGRGTAIFSGPAHRFAGGEKGTHELIVAATYDGELPAAVDLPANRSPQRALFPDSNGTTIPKTLTILPAGNGSERREVTHE